MKFDYLGNEVRVGDKVVFMQIGYRSFLVGRIVSLSEKTAVIRHPEAQCRKVSRQFYGQMIKHQNQDFCEIDEKIRQEEIKKAG